MAIDPKNHVCYNGIAEVYRDNKKDYAEAMSWYHKTLDVKTNERKACYGIGYCLNSTGKYAEAIPYLKTAVAEEPTYTAAFVELGYSHYRIDKNTEAIEYLNKALSLNPKNENARYYAVLVYVKQKNKTQAQKMVDELKNMSSKYVAELQKKVDAL
jgi:tetratricopeptide (TPR) repeat protein